MLFLALKSGLKIEWAAVVKLLRKALNKYVQNGSHVGAVVLRHFWSILLGTIFFTLTSHIHMTILIFAR